MEPTELLDRLHQLGQTEFFFGPQGFILVESVDELIQTQVGYSIDVDGTPLTGDENGDWQNEWVVFARDSELGDPYFLDISHDALPVFTAFLGESGWESEPVAHSLEAFLSCMKQLKEQSRQTQAVFVPDSNTLTDTTKLRQLRDKLGRVPRCQNFWKQVFENYQLWLNDKD